MSTPSPDLAQAFDCAARCSCALYNLVGLWQGRSDEIDNEVLDRLVEGARQHAAELLERFQTWASVPLWVMDRFVAVHDSTITFCGIESASFHDAVFSMASEALAALCSATNAEWWDFDNDGRLVGAFEPSRITPDAFKTCAKAFCSSPPTTGNVSNWDRDELDRVGERLRWEYVHACRLANAATPAEPATPTAASDAKNDSDLDRKFMEKAVEEARKSRTEDGRVHPKVGVVIVKDGKELAVAYRGELDKGEHAEFTALERKLADVGIAGATVYTTLEPCTTRNHPKLPCAVRLIGRKVRRVVIGMLDPNPRISGTGVHKLRRANIAVDLFPHDLASKVEEMNREFIRYHENSPEPAPSPLAAKTEQGEATIAGRPDQKGEIVSVIKTPADLLRWLQLHEHRGCVDALRGLSGRSRDVQNRNERADHGYGPHCLFIQSEAESAALNTVAEMVSVAHDWLDANPVPGCPPRPRTLSSPDDMLAAYSALVRLLSAPATTTAAAERPVYSASSKSAPVASTAEYDFFICHATEDKDNFVSPLAAELQRRGARVWFDAYTLKVGDSLRRSIDQGLAKSRFGIVVLSLAFFQKNWPKYELDGLVAREVAGEKVILPIWHGVSKPDVRGFSPTLADRVAIDASTHSVEQIADELCQVLHGDAQRP